MAFLSDDEVRALFYPGEEPIKNKQKPYIFNGNRCSCGGTVSTAGVCSRCHFDHGQALQEHAERRQAQTQPQVTAEERLALLASLFGQHCPDCHHGVLNQIGDCDVCDYRSQDHL